jgi:hypothetical protein
MKFLSISLLITDGNHTNNYYVLFSVSVAMLKSINTYTALCTAQLTAGGLILKWLCILVVCSEYTARCLGSKYTK